MASAEGERNEGVTVRDAATLILLREGSVLMGRRPEKAAFMPGKLVFPGGAVDPGDADVPLATPLAARCRAKLAAESTGAPEAFAAAAIRELWEEAGLVLGAPAPWPDPPPGWTGFAATGHRPHAAPLRFVFRAITPPGLPRRFDARFFLAEASSIAGDPDDLARSDGELRGLLWLPLAEAMASDIPFVTRLALSEVEALLAGRAEAGVAFLKNDDPSRGLSRL